MKPVVVLSLLLALCVPVAGLAAQSVPVPVLPADKTPPAASNAVAGTAPAPAPLRTLETIDALRPDIDWTPDPFARRANRFDGRFGGGPSPEQMALQHGGYLMYGITQALVKGGSWLNRATGGPAQIQAAHARDVPLDDEQIARAARWASPEAAQGD